MLEHWVIMAVNYRKKQEQYKHQISYFGKEFSRIKQYKLDPWMLTYIDRLKKYLLDKNFKNKTLIDIGTGSGYVAIEMAKLGMNVIACDLSRESLINAAEYKKQFKLRNLKLIECKAENISLKDNSVDYIVSIAVLEHIPDDYKAINEWKRILKPGGKMMIAAPISYRFVFPFFIPLSFIYDRHIGHLRRYTLQDLKRKFRLKIIKHMYSGHILKFLGFLISRIIRTNILDQLLEKIDKKGENRRYGATNIIVFFKK